LAVEGDAKGAAGSTHMPGGAAKVTGGGCVGSGFQLCPFWGGGRAAKVEQQSRGAAHTSLGCGRLSRFPDNFSQQLLCVQGSLLCP
jgi:hypothetical protein